MPGVLARSGIHLVAYVRNIFEELKLEEIDNQESIIAVLRQDRVEGGSMRLRFRGALSGYLSCAEVLLHLSQTVINTRLHTNEPVSQPLRLPGTLYRKILTFQIAIS
mmetsp:Transcript_12297/g.50644  ORF Transcript_12297/g.50644 Transcript_12297/m.50644 type:complete len:107 (-) Transcript_12297:366-686(-)